MSNENDPISLNIRGVTDLVQNKVNKVMETNENPEGIAGEKIDALTLDMSDAELLALRNEWEKDYAPYEAKLIPIVKKNKESYLGKKANGQWLAGDDTMAANLQFEAEETFLAAALSKNPEPVVYADNTPEGNAVAGAVKTMLQFHADQLVVRRKLSFMVRQWSINHLGVLKYGWNDVIDDVAVENRKIQDFIFDPNGYVDAYGDFSSYLGERITVKAKELVAMFPDSKEDIELVLDGKLGTEVVYTEWWTDEFCFKTYKDIVLDKHKNPYFNYKEEPTGEEELDEFGEPIIPEVRNHFAVPKKPYTFLSVFSLQEQPHDITGLIEQNIPNQRLITKRTEQADYNFSASNNGYAFSEDNFNQETAKQAAEARKKGNPILIPQGGPIDRAILPLPAQSLPNSFFTEIENSKNTLMSSWGVQGIAAQQPDEDQTARGMILNQAHDSSRIGGGIGDAIEQVADSAFNWLVQLYYVFYDEQHFAAVMGNAKAVEYVTLSSQDLDRQLVVSVSPDSMKPKDEITNINLAQALYDKGAIGPKTLLTMVDFPDPDEAASDGALWQIDKMAYIQMNFPELFAQLQGAQGQMQQSMGLPVQDGGVPPEAITEPPADLSQEPASAALSQVKLPPLGT